MPTIRKAFVFRLYPTVEQAAALDEVLHLCRDLYNGALHERREAYRLGHKSLAYQDQQNELPAVKAAVPEYKAVHSQVLQDVLRRVDRAFVGFFRRVRAGHTPGYPRFQGRNRYHSLTYPQYGNGAHLEYAAGKWGLLTLAKLGRLRVRVHRPIAGVIKTVTIRREADQWYVSFSCLVEVEPAPEPLANAAVGIDLGLLHFATLSTGEQIDHPRYFRRAQKRLAAAQQKLSRCQKRRHNQASSKRREHARLAVARAHRKVRNQRADFHHKLSRRLVAEYDLICFEDLAITNLTRRPKAKVDPTPTAETGATRYAPNGAAAKSGLNKSILDAGWGAFQQMCVCKAAWASRTVLFVDPRYTSQTCSRCRAIQKIPLGEREYRCPACHLTLDRDHNAAVNIIQAGKRTCTETPASPV
jgi:putative transposase